jgi:hypothetical protein
MGMLLQFSPRLISNFPATPRAERESAQVLLFTGVRYDRDGTVPKAGTARRTGRKRKG